MHSIEKMGTVVFVVHRCECTVSRISTIDPQKNVRENHGSSKDSDAHPVIVLHDLSKFSADKKQKATFFSAGMRHS